MAQQFLASIYRIGPNDLKNASGGAATAGVAQTFPSAGVRIYPVPPPAVTANGVTMVSIIALLPTGLNQPEKQYYSAQSVTALQTLANA